MCGIAGIVGRDHSDLTTARARSRCATSSRYRGPDGAGLQTDDHVRPGPSSSEHRRSRRRTSAALQRDGTVWVTYNGEIYNHTDVRRSSKPRAIATARDRDTETIVHAYEQWGDECVQRFRGMFAFAHLGCAAPAAAAGARSPWRQAALLGASR